MRFFIALLLVLALPINGMAQLLMPAMTSMPHSMSGVDGMNAMAPSHVIVDADDAEPECCEGHDHAKMTVCKTGQECKTASLLQIAAAKGQALPAAKPVTHPFTDQIPSRLLDAVWHPPRA